MPKNFVEGSFSINQQKYGEKNGCNYDLRSP